MAGSVKMKIVRNTKVFFPFEWEIFHPKQYSVPKMATFIIPVVNKNFKQTQLQTGLSGYAIIKVFACLRNLRPLFAKNPIWLGGPVVIAQADESCFLHKPKYHRGRGPQKTQWVFGIVDTSHSPAIGYMEMVDTRDTETLLPIIN